MDELIKVSTSIYAISLKLLDFKDDLVTLPKDYTQQVDSIDSKLAIYREHARLHGLDADSRMMEILKRAEDSLKRAASRLDGLSTSASSNPCYSHIMLWYAKLSLVLFPENIEKILKKGNEDIDDILEVLKTNIEISAQMQLTGRQRAIQTLTYDTDNLYIPIEKVQSTVIEKIEDPKGLRIVLLHGGVGKGKSTLARYMVHLYGNKENQEKGKLFEHVIWVSCSNCSEKDVSTKQLEILQQYSPNSLGDSPPNDTSSQTRIAQALKDFLSAKKALIIFDDVSNPSFLREMWKATKATIHAQAIRYLVTSQLENICKTASLQQDSLPIFMEDVTHDEAMGILASHVGLESIPARLQVITEKIILAVDKNPLALACLASHFANSGGNTEERAWQDASTELQKLLNNTEEKIVLDSTPRNLWAAMTLCVNTLKTVDAKKILFMMYECKAVSVPEAVLRIWHSRISKCTFFQTIEELRVRELLKPAVNSKNEGQNYRVSKAWSLGSLVKYYIEEYMVDEIGPVIGELVGGEELGPESSTLGYKQVSEPQTAKAEKARVALLLCALYFDQSHFHTYEIVSNALTRAKIACSHESFSHLRREAVQPFIWLLDKPTDGHWRDADVCCVRKVFLGYICKSELDDKNVSQLLTLEGCTVAQLATLEAIRQICYIEEKPLFNAENLNFVQAIVPLMDLTRGLPTNVQESASRTLRAICWKVGDQMSVSQNENARLGTLIIDLPGVLHGLVSAFASPNQQSDVVVEHVASVFSSLAYCEGIGDSTAAPIRERILNEKGVLEGLVKCLYAHKKPGLQIAAAKVISNLAFSSSDPLKLRVANQDGMLEGLVTLLSAHDKPDVQEQAARALAKLADTGDNARSFEEGKALLRGTDGLLEGLSSLLENGVLPSVQFWGARALTFISPMQGKGASLTSKEAYKGRADAFIRMGMYKEGLVDLDQAGNLRKGMDSTALSLRCFVKAKLEDFEGALDDATEVVKVSNSYYKPFALQERGVLKRMMGNLEGALADLDEGLKLETDDYELLKHRGYVKFLLKDEEGARADAERALRINHPAVDGDDYETDASLGREPAEYLGYKLK